MLLLPAADPGDLGGASYDDIDARISKDVPNGMPGYVPPTAEPGTDTPEHSRPQPQPDTTSPPRKLNKRSENH